MPGVCMDAVGLRKIYRTLAFIHAISKSADSAYPRYAAKTFLVSPSPYTVFIYSTCSPSTYVLNTTAYLARAESAAAAGQLSAVLLSSWPYIYFAS